MIPLVVTHAVAPAWLRSGECSTYLEGRLKEKSTVEGRAEVGAGKGQGRPASAQLTLDAAAAALVPPPPHARNTPPAATPPPPLAPASGCRAWWQYDVKDGG